MTTVLKLGIRLALLIIAIVLLLFIWFKFLKPADKPVEPEITHQTVLQEITAMGKLELVKFTFKDVVEYKKGATGYQTINQFLPDAKAVLIVVGEAIGCIDLTKIQTDDVIEQGDTVIVYLPEPELCVFKINHQQSKLYDLNNGYFIEKGKMIDEAYKVAEKQVQKSALEMGILTQTNENARKILGPTLEKISGKKVLLHQRLKGNLDERKK
ncbi:MAG: DUF4230 domain-containing protein [Verrucomicrobia bacterium]|nr:DUF4230 domain-containing protein [Cytophagales bacterium]